jgi:hypothetical protein
MTTWRPASRSGPACVTIITCAAAAPIGEKGGSGIPMTRKAAGHPSSTGHGADAERIPRRPEADAGIEVNPDVKGPLGIPVGPPPG